MIAQDLLKMNSLVTAIYWRWVRQWLLSTEDEFVNDCYLLKMSYSGIFYSCQFIKSFRPFHSFWEEDDLSWEINKSFTEWHHYHIMGIQFQGHLANSAVAYL